MKKFLIIVLCTVTTIAAETTWTQKEQYTIEYDKDSQVGLFFNQMCNIENDQHQQNQYTFPLGQSATPPEDVSGQTTPASSSLLSLEDLFTPLKLSFAGCLMVALYYFKAKLTLYSLSKACIENAFWSLWQTATKQTDLLYDNQEQDLSLLYAILQTYRTDKHAVAISRFIQDVESEMELLNRYIIEATNTQSSILYFALPDMSQDILEAQARLAKLAYLKQKVIYWMAHGTATERTKQPINACE